MSAADDDDLTVTEESGYKAPKQATLEEMKKKDADDEALNKWKASLIKELDPAAAPKNDPRRVVVLALAMEVQGRPDVVLELDSPAKIEQTKKSPVTIKEGVEYRLKVKFRVQHEIVTGLKYLQGVKRAGITVDKTEEMIGSYGPQVDPYTKVFPAEQAPSGMLTRGHYSVKSKFTDDDKNVHLAWEWSFDIKKDWD